MNTFAGRVAVPAPAALDETAIADAAVLYLEGGYLWDRRALRGHAQGDRRGARGRAQGGLHFVRCFRDRAAWRRFPR